MCGICGIKYYDSRSVDVNDLRAMTDRMVHRGPDDEGYYCKGNTGIGMRRLSIIDLDGGHQPICNEDASIWVVLNGEIYNYIELRQELEKKGHTFRTASDTEVIVHLYEDKGVDALSDLNGMFAFALYDTRKDALWLARDRLGIKPLYYHQSKDSLVFGSDLNCLRGIIDLAISREAVVKYLGLAYVPTPYSILEGVRKLPPAHHLWIEGENLTCQKYWHLNEIQMWCGSTNEAIEELERLFMDAIRLQFRSDVPVGVFLSGGVDSSAVVAMAAEASGMDLTTLTIDFEEKHGEDSRFARDVANRFSTNHRETSFGFSSFLQDLDGLIDYLDEPVADTAIIPSFRLSKAARQNGIKVLLTGAGGDEVFGGYQRHFRPRFGSPRWMAERLPAPIRYMVSRSWTMFQPQRGLRAGDWRLAFAVEASGTNLSFLKTVLREKTVYQEMVGSAMGIFSGFSEEYNVYDYMHYRMKVDLDNYLVDDVLSLTDKSTMAASVEGRVPLLDHRLVEFAFSLPSNISLKNSEPKALFKLMLKKRLPSDLLNRGKEGFNAPANAWMVDTFTNSIREELLNNIAPVLQDLLDRSSLESILGNATQRSAAGHSLFALYLFNKWWHAHKG